MRLLTNSQLRALWACARKAGLDSERLHEMAAARCNVESLKKLTRAQADELIVALGGKAQGTLSPRTQQLHRQRAGVARVVTPEQLEKIALLASQRHWTPEGLTKFIRRQTGHDKPQTTRHANSVIEALKSMNKREGLYAG